jgi:predicted RNase H-like HicB family nuclease
MTPEKAKISITGVFLESADGGFMAYLSEIPEVATEGDTIEEAEQNLFNILPDVLEVRNEIIAEQRVIHGQTGITKKFEFQLV